MIFGEYPSALHRTYSLADQLDEESRKSKHPRRHYRHHKISRPNIHVFNSFPWHKDKISSKTISVDDICNQPSASNERRPSIIKNHPIPKSDLSQSISKKSVTFASIFDDEKIANQNDEIIADEIPAEETTDQNKDETSIDNSEEQKIDDIIIDTPAISTDPEPYPFRSEVPPISISSNELPKSSDHLDKTTIPHFAFHHRPKKLRHPINTTNLITPENRTISSPNIFSSTANNNPHPHHPLDSIRTWMKSSSIGRFVRSLVKPSYDNSTSKQKDLPLSKGKKPKPKKKLHIMSTMTAAMQKNADIWIY